LTAKGEVRNWLFKSLAAETLLSRLETEGLSVRAPSDPGALQRVVDLEDFPPSIRKAAMQALPVFLGFFCFENAVRQLVAERLSETYGPDWWTTKVGAKLQENVRKRQEEEGIRRWHVKRGEQEIYYTDFGDLKSLIQAFWGDFDDLFPDQNWIVSRLDELEASRNIIAHSNLVDDREMTRIRLYVQDWIRQVG
jgi:hypothetical protein